MCVTEAKSVLRNVRLLGIPKLSPGGRARPGLLFTAVTVVTTVPQGMTVRSISTFLL